MGAGHCTLLLIDLFGGSSCASIEQMIPAKWRGGAVHAGVELMIPAKWRGGACKRVWS